MFENFRSDIIYYKTNSDFELEFSLGGCNRKMRLLPDKCSDAKTLLYSLSRAVSRSRIIIITAPLFSEEKVINIIASAIGMDVETVDNSQYRINSSNKIEIIKNSVPLVTSDGIFGGCIIESGPQALIIVTDTKAVRKNIMTNLIHPYIKEFSKYPQEEPLAKPEETDSQDNLFTETTEETISDEELVSTDEELIFENTEASQQTDITHSDNLENELLTESDETDTEEPEEYDSDYGNLILESDEEPYENTEDIYKTQADDLILEADNDEEDSEYIKVDPISDISNTQSVNIPKILIDDETFEDDYDEENDQPISPLNTWMVILLVFILITIAVLFVCIFYIPAKEGLDPATNLKEILNTMFG